MKALEHCFIKILELLDLSIWQYQEPEITKQEIDEIQSRPDNLAHKNR